MYVYPVSLPKGELIGLVAAGIGVLGELC